VHAVFPLSALQPGVRFRLQMSNGRVHTLSPDAAWFESPR
jgi:hypothetical protein